MAKPGIDGGASFKLDRKTVEKNRRIHMKSLCSKLFNLVPSSHYKISKDLLSQQTQISYVIAYINELKERVESLEKKKEALQLQIHSQLPTSSDSTFPIVEVRELCSGIVHVTLISSVDRNVMLNEIIGVVEEEGGEVVSASFSTLGDKVFHSLHIEAKIPRVGIETSRVEKRLKHLIIEAREDGRDK
ncbi:transcription factor bHLH168-like [Cucurbita pepo subsp. pepo]|uniref:transcription factor bHLH168-like n=1 Tax=Cucurbita pepo subsp. pepo TaxID=3664 RepID=UPI000C9D7E10|nr:transcription factor bHLH168-like [Cucurbita pepo subsp. pepo]